MDIFDHRTIVLCDTLCFNVFFNCFYVMWNVFILFYLCMYFVRNDEIKLWYIIMWKKEDYTQLSFVNVCMGLSCHLSFMQILRQASLFPVDNVIIDCVNDFEMVDVWMHSGSFDDVSYREQSCETHYPVSILRGWNKMALILQTTFWNSFSLMKIFTFWLKFYHGHLILNDKYIIPLKFHCPQTTYLRIVIYWF